MEGVQHNWRRKELSLLDTLGCKSDCSTTRKRASNPGTARDSPRHCKDEKLGKKLCVLAEHGCRPGSQRVDLYEMSVKLTPYRMTMLT